MGQSDFADGDLNAWVVSTAPRMLGYAWTLVHHRQVAEDLVQDCFCRLLARSDQYDLPRDGTKLLYRSVTNAAINWTQRQSVEASLRQLPDAGSSAGGVLADSSAAEPVQIVIRRELEQAVEKAMRDLPVQQRVAIELRSLGHSLVDVAEILEISHANARVLVHRARATLTERLHPFLEEDAK